MYSSAAEVQVNAITYTENHKDPAEVVRASSFRLPKLHGDKVRLRYRLSPLNPADFNVIQGTYPYKPSLRRDLLPEPFFVGGNEGFAEVEEVGASASTSLKPGDWVIMGAPQLGTWQSRTDLSPSLVVPISKSSLSPLAAATLMVNPSTALRLLTDFAQLEPGEWVVQNGANSAVGQAVIQIAKARGLRTVNLVRDRDDFDALKARLEALGGDEVATYSQLSDRSFSKDLLGRLTSSSPRSSAPRLGLNCVSGPDTTTMVSALLKAPSAHLVTYGGMSRQPVSLPTSAFIFRDLKAHGFNMTKWYETQSGAGGQGRDRREEMVEQLTELYRRGELKEVEAEIVDVGEAVDGATRQERVRDAIRKSMGGRGGKKYVLQWS